MEDRFEYIKGRKKEGDRIMKFNGVAVKFEDVAIFLNIRRSFL